MLGDAIEIGFDEMARDTSLSLIRARADRRLRARGFWTGEDLDILIGSDGFPK